MFLFNSLRNLWPLGKCLFKSLKQGCRNDYLHGGGGGGTFFLALCATSVIFLALHSKT